MPLLTTVIDLQPARTGTAVPGYPAQIAAAQPHLASLATIYPEDCAMFVGAGRSDLAALIPLQERDAGGARIWAALNGNTTRVALGGVLGGLPRFVLPGATFDGLYASLDAALTDYTVAVLARASNVTGAKWLFGVGSTGAGRLGVYFNGANVTVQHATTDVVTTPGTVVVANAWVPVIVSYLNAGRAVSVHVGSPVAAVTGTMTNSPPADVAAALGAVPVTGLQPLVGELAFCALWRRALHTDAAALARAVTAMNGLAALT